MAIGLSSAFEVFQFETLNAAGVTSSVETTGSGLTFQVDVTNIGTNVVLRPEGSLDGIGFFPLRDSSNTDFTITANGTYGYAMIGPVRFTRMRVVSVSGGTPSIATQVGAA
jgi:hypothetical protein